MNDDLFAAYLQSMTRVCSALKPHHHFRTAGQQVYYFPFTFITPLSANDYKSIQITMPLWFENSALLAGRAASPD